MMASSYIIRRLRLIVQRKINGPIGMRQGIFCVSLCYNQLCNSVGDRALSNYVCMTRVTVCSLLVVRRDNRFVFVWNDFPPTYIYANFAILREFDSSKSRNRSDRGHYSLVPTRHYHNSIIGLMIFLGILRTLVWITSTFSRRAVIWIVPYTVRVLLSM
jgi:hypothetical protein